MQALTTREMKLKGLAFGGLAQVSLQELSAPFKSLSGGAVEAGVIVQFLGSAGSEHPA